MKLSPLERIVMGVAAALVLGTAIVLSLGDKPVSVVVVTESERPSGRVVASEGKKLPGDAGGLFQLPDKTEAPAGTDQSFSKAPETSPPAGADSGVSGPTAAVSELPETAKAEEKINLNTATAKELEQLPGIGEKRAAAIVAYREAHGPFEKIERVTRVSGIGSGIFNQIKPYITVK
ncbi:MAG: ComEA family DNA-binding protein [Oscillospiraceae bacterium]|jgi:competence ComEA-like helix-hairpin-helix protein